MSTSFATITFIGPGETEARRLRQVMDSLIRYEPSVDAVVIIDDQSKLEIKEIVPAELRQRTVVLPNLRNGQGAWWQGGLCVGLADGLRWLGVNRNLDFAVRLDTDALVIAPFAERIAGQFRRLPQAGLLGTWDRYAVSGAQRIPHAEGRRILTPILGKARRLFTVWRHSEWPTRVQCVLRKRDAVVRRLIASAMANGYELGDFLQGGAYAISGRLTRSLFDQNFVKDPLAFLPQFFGEDVLATLFCYACGLQPHGFNQKGDVFGVQYQGLPGSPLILREHGYGIIHSIKNDPVHSEDAILAAFSEG